MTCFLEALHKFKECNRGALPERTVIYRDGVGEGQLRDVEVKPLKERLNMMYGDQPYRIAFIVVTKRINTRLFLGSGNPPPGIVADDDITIF
ncbi:Protein piwi [Zootermopsis nevadensis]|uniref:Protein piwi n=1 Tax=Zootermopsis nevadensis TaxID=136037 RepID=A0A067QGT8_ZOONE|nr:Protein piwi [Zootermopsis nevadensis]